MFVGRLFVADRDCLGTTSSIDVVTGEDPGTCAPTCLVDTLADASDKVYVSTMCAPFPFGFDAAGTNPECGRALAAFGRDDTCLSDGGTTNPAPPAPDAAAASDVGDSGSP